MGSDWLYDVALRAPEAVRFEVFLAQWATCPFPSATTGSGCHVSMLWDQGHRQRHRFQCIYCWSTSVGKRGHLRRWAPKQWAFYAFSPICSPIRGLCYALILCEKETRRTWQAVSSLVWTASLWCCTQSFHTHTAWKAQPDQWDTTDTASISSLSSLH